ncbi:MAG: DUF4292 domain-containing protein [Bacteroidales bacterium]|jgi:glyoxylase-like metal-dependent hydrolase (beta-lactamase superfamily II)|nr:DUF4292 domain-containing protein [Bacteroidales bacterium]
MKKEKNERISIGLLIICTCSLISYSCEEKDKEPDIQIEEVSDVFEAMGGIERIKVINTISYKSFGKTYEWEQPTPVEPNPLFASYYEATFSSELNHRKVRVEYDYIQYKHPFSYRVNEGTHIINDRRGTVSGEYNWSSFYYNDHSANPMHSSMIESILKNQKMANPVELLKEYLLNPEEVKFHNGKFVYPTRIKDLNIELIIDPETHLPLKAEVKEADYLQGDSKFEVHYDDWTEIEYVKFPAMISFYLNDQVLKIEQLSDITFNPDLNNDHFTPKEVSIELSYDEANADTGVLRSQWFHRWTAWGIRMDPPYDKGAIIGDKFDLSYLEMGDQTIGENVRMVGRPDLPWSVLIKTKKGIYIWEAPLHNALTFSIIEAAKREYPDVPIIGAIVSHTHHVFFSGIRQLVAETGEVYVGKEGYNFAKKVMESKHTMLPDTLAIVPRNVKIIPVDTIVNIDDGAVQIHPLITSDPVGTVTSGPHSTDMLVVYVPEYEAIIQGDMQWEGVFMNIWYGKTAKGYTPETIAELKRRANYLIDYIREHNLKVTKIVGSHGGVGTIKELEDIANYQFE